MAKTQAERAAAYRRRKAEAHEKELAALKANQAPSLLAPPSQLAPGVTKARSNQFKDWQKVAPPARRVVPDLEAAKQAFAARMKEARIAAGLSQADIAIALFGPDPDGTYRKRYINWEIGRSFMTQNVIPVFAELVGVDCNFLFSDRSPP